MPHREARQMLAVLIRKNRTPPRSFQMTIVTGAMYTKETNNSRDGHRETEGGQVTDTTSRGSQKAACDMV